MLNDIVQNAYNIDQIRLVMAGSDMPFTAYALLLGVLTVFILMCLAKIISGRYQPTKAEREVGESSENEPYKKFGEHSHDGYRQLEGGGYNIRAKGPTNYGDQIA